jgi:hypothetical protein
MVSAGDPNSASLETSECGATTKSSRVSCEASASRACVVYARQRATDPDTGRIVNLFSDD